MRIVFCFDKADNTELFKVKHADITEKEIIELFANPSVMFESKKIYQIIGHTNNKRYLVIVGVYGDNGTVFRVFTAYPASKKYLIYYKKEVMKYDQ